MSRRSTKKRLREMKAEWRESHLCLRCDHHHVCRFIASLDLNFCVAISQCTAFEPVRNAEQEAGR